MIVSIHKKEDQTVSNNYRVDLSIDDTLKCLPKLLKEGQEKTDLNVDTDS